MRGESLPDARWRRECNGGRPWGSTLDASNREDWRRSLFYKYVSAAGLSAVSPAGAKRGVSLRELVVWARSNPKRTGFRRGVTADW